jgi:hypothetical protein
MVEAGVAERLAEAVVETVESAGEGGLFILSKQKAFPEEESDQLKGVADSFEPAELCPGRNDTPA